MKSTNHLTELACRKASSPGKKLSDGQGMYLLVHKNGSKYWRLDYRLNGKRKTLAIAVWPEVSLTRARELREEAREQIQRGNTSVTSSVDVLQVMKGHFQYFVENG